MQHTTHSSRHLQNVSSYLQISRYHLQLIPRSSNPPLSDSPHQPWGPQDHPPPQEWLPLAHTCLLGQVGPLVLCSSPCFTLHLWPTQQWQSWCEAPYTPVGGFTCHPSLAQPPPTPNFPTSPYKFSWFFYIYHFASWLLLRQKYLEVADCFLIWLMTTVFLFNITGQIWVLFHSSLSPHLPMVDIYSLVVSASVTQTIL